MKHYAIGGHDPRYDKLIAQAASRGTYLEAARRWSKMYREAHSDARRQQLDELGWTTTATWLPSVKVWRRMSTSVKTKPRRSEPRPYPIKGTPLDGPLLPPHARAMSVVTARGVVQLELADRDAIEHCARVAINDRGEAVPEASAPPGAPTLRVVGRGLGWVQVSLE